MNEYLVIIKILTKVINGANLSEEFASNTLNLNTNYNVSRIKDISYGVLRNYYRLNSLIKALVAKPPGYKVIIFLLIAFYEINYTKKPVFAITNDIVNLSFKLTKSLSIKNFINAILRNYLRNKEKLHLQLLINSEYKYNFPLWWIEKLKQDYPQQFLEIINNSNLKPKIALRVNPKKINLAVYIEKLKIQQIKFSFINNKIVLTDFIAVPKIPGFKEGLVSIQDISAQQLIDLINFKSEDYILDACCAPGGKLCQILENNEVNLLGIDISNYRLEKVGQNLTRLGLKAKLIQADASELTWWNGKLFDGIIADVPCSASGTLKRNPDIKLHRQINDINDFVATQRKIVLNLWQTLKLGGILVYITCSIFKEENQENIYFLSKNLPSVKVMQELLILPTKNNDGFYYCILKKE